MKKHYLVEKIIQDIKIASDKKALLFITDQGKIIAKADGDCCSSTWIENVEFYFNFPAKVMSVENIEMPDLGSLGKDAVTKYYGCKIITNKGDIVIDYRNESNGYYGGNLSWPDDDYFYGGVHGQNISSEEWVLLKQFKTT